MDRTNPKLFFQKTRLINKMIPKIKETEEIFSLGKVNCFLKVSKTFYKKTSEIISTIVMKER